MQVIFGISSGMDMLLFYPAGSLGADFSPSVGRTEFLGLWG